MLDRREQREERGHDLRLGVALALDLNVLLVRREGDAGLVGGVEDGDDLTQPREFTDDQAGPALEDAHQLVESPALLGAARSTACRHVPCC